MADGVVEKLDRVLNEFSLLRLELRAARKEGGTTRLTIIVVVVASVIVAVSVLWAGQVNMMRDALGMATRG